MDKPEPPPHQRYERLIARAKQVPAAKTVVLEREFKSRSADEAGLALLDRIRPETTQ